MLCLYKPHEALDFVCPPKQEDVISICTAQRGAAVHRELTATMQIDVSVLHLTSGDKFERETRVVAGHTSHESLSGKRKPLSSAV